MRRVLSLALAVLGLLGAVVPTACARVPKDFFGVIGDGPLTAGGQNLDTQARLMRTAHVGVLRTSFYWDAEQPDPSQPPSFLPTDGIVLAAAKQGITVLPVVLRAPAWAREDPGNIASPPRDPETYGRFLTALVARYGVTGTLWAQYPGVPKRPIRRWQIWNEPDLSIDFQPAASSWEEPYVKLARAARTALKAADPRSTVLCAGLTNRSWEHMASLYGAGIKGVCDQMAVHPYTKTVANLLLILQLNRIAMRRAGDGARPLVVTEMTFTSGRGRSTINLGFEQDEQGQASRLRSALRRVARQRAVLNIVGAYWYTWMSPALGMPSTFDYAGLLRLDSKGTAVRKPAFTAYQQTVAALER